MANQDLKYYAKDKAVRLWQVAEVLEITDFQLSRKLRHELNAAERENFIRAVDGLADTRSDDNHG